MIFYLCQTPEGPKLAPTQADAKALDRKFKQVDVPTDKANLMAYVNDLFAKAHGSGGETPTQTRTVSVPAEAFIDEAPADEALFVTQRDADKINANRPAMLGKLTPAEIEKRRTLQRDCPKCGTNPATRLSESIGEIEKFVEALPDDKTYVLDTIEATVKIKREDISRRVTQEAKPLPKPRVRERVRG